MASYIHTCTYNYMYSLIILRLLYNYILIQTYIVPPSKNVYVNAGDMIGVHCAQHSRVSFTYSNGQHLVEQFPIRDDNINSGRIRYASGDMQNNQKAVSLRVIQRCGNTFQYFF